MKLERNIFKNSNLKMEKKQNAIKQKIHHLVCVGFMRLGIIKKLLSARGL